MLKSSHRMTREQFKRVFKESEVLHTPHFIVRQASGIAFKPSASVVISKKVEKSAVKRHRLRRQLYSIIGEILSEKDGPVAFIIVAKRGSNTLSFAEIKLEIRRIL